MKQIRYPESDLIKLLIKRWIITKVNYKNANILFALLNYSINCNQDLNILLVLI